MTRARAKEIATNLGAFLWDAIDLRDLLFAVGLTVAWYGGAKISWPWSCVAVGLLLIGVAAIGVKPQQGGE